MAVLLMDIYLQIKDSVCGPGGATMYGIQKMEAKGVRGAYIDAVLAATDRAKAQALIK